MAKQLAMLLAVACMGMSVAQAEPLQGKPLPAPQWPQAGPAWLAGEVSYADGRKVGGVTVEAIFIAPEPHLEPLQGILHKKVQADVEGRFVFTGLPVADYVLLAMADGGVAQYEVAADQLEAYQAMTLRPALAGEGRVLNDAGEPIAGAVVETAWPQTELRGSLLSVTTDAEGRFHVQVAEPKRPLAIRATGYGSELLSLERGRSEPYEVRLPKGQSVSGAVVDAGSGQPVAGLRLTLRAITAGRDYRHTVTDAQGNFRFDALGAAAWMATIEDAAFAPADEPAEIDVTADHGAEGLQIEVEPAGRIEGHIKDAATGEPIPGVIVTAEGRHYGAETAAVSDKAGAFVLEGLRKDGYALDVEKPGYVLPEGKTAPRVAIETTPSVANVDISLLRKPGTVRVAGRVTDAAGAAVPGAWVGAEASDRCLDIAWSDAEGRFEFPALPPGSLYLRARTLEAAGGTGPIEVNETGLTDAVVAVQPAAAVAGRVADAAGDPLFSPPFRGRITAEPAERPGVAAGTAFTDASGGFRIPGLASGAYNLFLQGEEAGKPPAPTQLAKVELSPGQTAPDVALVYTAGDILSVSGRITDRNGNPLRATVDVSGLNRGRQSTAETAEDGTFTVRGLSPGECMLWASSPGYAQKNSNVIQAGAKDVVLQLGRAAKIDGRVLNAETNEPVPDFGLWHNPGDVQMSETPFLRPVHHAEGRFVIDPADVGPVTIMVAAPGLAVTRVVCNVPESGNATVEVALRPAVKLTGVVRDEKGEPIKDAQVQIGETSVRSDSIGRFEIECSSGEELPVQVQARGYAPWKGSAGEAKALEVVLTRGCEIRGTVRIGGQPAPGVSLSVYNDRDSQDCTTGADGTYALSGLTPGRSNLQLNLQSDRVQHSFSREATVKEGPPQVIDFDLPAAEDVGVIEGAVLADGKPMQWAGVNFNVDREGDLREFWYCSSEGGSFRLEGVPVGRHRLSAYGQVGDRHRQKQVEIEVVKGQVVRCDIRFDTPAPVSGVVKGIPEGGSAFVALVQGDAKPESADAAALRALMKNVVVQSGVGPDGAFRFDRVDQGAYTVLVWTADAPPRFTTVPLEVKSSDEAKVEVTLP